MAYFVRSLTYSDQRVISVLNELDYVSSELEIQLQILLLSNQRMKSSKIANELAISPTDVLKTIKQFNLKGLKSLELPSELFADESLQIKQPLQLAAVELKPKGLTLSGVNSSRRKEWLDLAVQTIFTGNNSDAQEFFTKLTSVKPNELNALQADFDSWHKRCLEECYLYVYLATIDFTNQTNQTTSEREANKNNPILQAAMGIKLDGNKELLSLGYAPTSSREAWLDFLTDLSNRGLRTTNLWVVDGGDDCHFALKQLYPGQLYSICYNSLTNHVLHLVPLKQHNQVIQAIKRVYKSSSHAKAIDALERLILILEGTSPQNANWLEQNFEEILNFYRMPREHWFYLKSTHCLQEPLEFFRRWLEKTVLPESKIYWPTLFFAFIRSLSLRKLNVLSA